MGITSYVGPGVQVFQNPTPQFGGVGTGPRVLGIVGTGHSYVPILDTPVVKGAPNGTDIVPVGSYTLVNVTLVGDTPDTNQYISGTDYSVVNGSIQWISTGKQPTTGATYYVTWNRAKVYPQDYVPGPTTTFTNGQMATVRTTYGSELENGVYNVIPLAANLAFQNGAAQIIISQSLTGAQTDLQNAIDQMKSQNIRFLVIPQATNSTLDTYAWNHVTTQSAPSVRHERVFITSADGWSDTTTTIGAKAAGYSSDRFWMLAPPSVAITLQDAVTNQPEQLLIPSALALASAYAGVVCNPANDDAQPLLRQPIVGIDNLSSFNYQETDKNLLGSYGVTVINNDPPMYVRDALTTNITNVNTVTASVRVLTDYIIINLRSGLNRAFIGTKITSQTTAQIAGAVTTFMNNLLNPPNQIIQAFLQGSLSVQQSTIDPRTINISFTFMPIYPLTYINVQMSLVTSTNAV